LHDPTRQLQTSEQNDPRILLLNMAFVNEEVLRNIAVLTEGETTEIKDCMRTKVDLWIEKKRSRKFTVRKLLALAKIDPDWTGTPLRALTDHYLGFHTEVAARKAAGRALGWLVKSMLKEDARVFYTSQGAVRNYWLKA
jgi:hypothetical protein